MMRTRLLLKPSTFNMFQNEQYTRLHQLAVSQINTNRPVCLFSRFHSLCLSLCDWLYLYWNLLVTWLSVSETTCVNTCTYDHETNCLSPVMSPWMHLMCMCQLTCNSWNATLIYLSFFISYCIITRFITIITIVLMVTLHLLCYTLNTS